MEYRRLCPSDDTQAIAQLAVRGLRPNLYPLHLSMPKIVAMIEHFRASERDFSMAAFVDGKPVAAIAVLRQEMPWFERHEATVVMLFSTVPGAGFRLLREALRWFSQDLMLRRLTWPLEYDVEPRILRIAERMGFNFSNVNLSVYKG